MEEEETDKILVVFLANALADPDAVMVKLGNAHPAYGAVLGASWLGHFAGLTFVLFFVHDSVVVPLETIDILFLIRSGDFAWGH